MRYFLRHRHLNSICQKRHFYSMFNETRAILDVAFENPIEVKSYGKQPPHTVVQLSENHLKAVALIFLLEISRNQICLERILSIWTCLEKSEKWTLAHSELMRFVAFVRKGLGEYMISIHFATFFLLLKFNIIKNLHSVTIDYIFLGFFFHGNFTLYPSAWVSVCINLFTVFEHMDAKKVWISPKKVPKIYTFMKKEKNKGKKQQIILSSLRIFASLNVNGTKIFI